MIKLGSVSVEGSIVGFLVYGLSHQHCIFKSQENDEKVIAIETGDQKSGYRCTNCGLVVIEAKESVKEKDRRIATQNHGHYNIT